MYIATVPNRSSRPAILLRESFRQDGKVNSRTLANLSHWDPARIQALQRALRGDFDHLASPDPTLGLVFGLLFVLKQIADALGLTAALGKSRLAKLALFLVLARVAHQGSRLSAVRWAKDHAVAEVLGLAPFDEDDLYAALDDLCGRQEASTTPWASTVTTAMASAANSRSSSVCWPTTRANRWRRASSPATPAIRPRWPSRSGS